MNYREFLLARQLSLGEKKNPKLKPDHNTKKATFYLYIYWGTFHRCYLPKVLQNSTCKF